jgi:hypothetical protein
VPVSNMRKWYNFVGRSEFVVLRVEPGEPKQTTKYKCRSDQKVDANKFQLQIQI